MCTIIHNYSHAPVVEMELPNQAIFHYHDDCFSALDAESESLVHDALERVMVGRTVITIAHRLSTIRNAHQIAVLDAGQVAELGTYDDLMKIPDGIFLKLVERQTIGWK